MAQSIEEFGKLIKAKYPQYADISDAELGQKMLAKYPQYQDLISKEQPKAVDTFLSGHSILKGISDFVGTTGLGKGLAQGIFLRFTPEGKDILKQIEEGKMKYSDLEAITGSAATTKEVVGSAAQVGATFIPGVGQSAKLGTKILAGAGTGYAFDVAKNLQQEKEGMDILKPGLGTVVGGALGAITGLIHPSEIAKGSAKKLEEINLRLTPVDKQRIAKDGKDIVSYLSEKKIVGTPAQRFLKLNDEYGRMEGKVQEIIKGSGVSFDRKSVIKELQVVPELFKENLDEYQGVVSKVDNVIKTLNTKFDKTITAEQLNSIKRKIYDNAYSKNNTDVVNDALKAIGDVFKSNLDQKVTGLQRLNKEYGMIITAKNLLFKAQSRPEIGLVGKAIGTAAGATVGGAIGGAAGAVAGTVAGPLAGKILAGTPVRSALGAGFQKISETINKIPTDKIGNLQITRKALLDLIQKIR